MRKFLLATTAAGIIGLAAPLSVLAQGAGGPAARAAPAVPAARR